MPPRKRTATTTTETDGPTPAEAAVAEANDDDVVVQFRDTEYRIPRERLRSPAFLIAMGNNNILQVTVAALDPVQQAQFIASANQGEDGIVMMADFVEALGQSAGWGNS